MRVKILTTLQLEREKVVTVYLLGLTAHVRQRPPGGRGLILPASVNLKPSVQGTQSLDPAVSVDVAPLRLVAVTL